MRTKILFLTILVFAMNCKPDKKLDREANQKFYEKQIPVSVQIQQELQNGKEKELSDTLYIGNKIVKIISTITYNNSISHLTKLQFFKNVDEKKELELNIEDYETTELDVVCGISFREGANLTSRFVKIDKTTGKIDKTIDKPINVNNSNEQYQTPKLTQIISKINSSEEYKIACKNPNIENTGKAMSFILYKTELKQYFDSLDKFQLYPISDYLNILFNTNLEYISNLKNKTSFQLQGHNLNEQFKKLVVNSSIGNMPYKNDLQKLTELIKSITIPTANNT